MLVSLGVLIHDWGGFATREHCLRRNSNAVREEYNAELFFASTNGQIKSLLDMKSEVSEEDPCRSALFCPGVKHPNARHLLSSHTSGRGITRGQLCSQLNLLPLHPLVFLGQTTARGERFLFHGSHITGSPATLQAPPSWAGVMEMTFHPSSQGLRLMGTREKIDIKKIILDVNVRKKSLKMRHCE